MSPCIRKRAIPFSLALRLRRICSTDEIFTLRNNELMKDLHKRCYNRHFLRQEIRCKEHHPKRSTFTKKHYHDHFRQIWMGSILANIQPSSPLWWRKAVHFETVVDKVIYVFLSSWAGGIQQILQSDWFRERAKFSHSASCRRVESTFLKNCFKFVWKQFKTTFVIT